MNLFPPPPHACKFIPTCCACLPLFPHVSTHSIPFGDPGSLRIENLSVNCFYEWVVLLKDSFEGLRFFLQSTMVLIPGNHVAVLRWQWKDMGFPKTVQSLSLILKTTCITMLGLCPITPRHLTLIQLLGMWNSHPPALRSPWATSKSLTGWDTCNTDNQKLVMNKRPIPKAINLNKSNHSQDNISVIIS